MGDVNVVIPALLVALALGGAIVRRWWFAAVPLVVWPLVYAGMRYRGWLDGLGDGWVFAAVIVTAFSALATAIAVGLGRGGYPRSTSRVQ